MSSINTFVQDEKEYTTVTELCLIDKINSDIIKTINRSLSPNISDSEKEELDRKADELMENRNDAISGVFDGVNRKKYKISFVGDVYISEKDNIAAILSSLLGDNMIGKKYDMSGTFIIEN